MATDAPPLDLTDGRRHRRLLSTCVRLLLQGKLNIVQSVTLTNSATSTTVADPLCTPSSHIVFDPLSSDAAAELAAGTLYVAEADRTSGSFIITHSSGTSTRSYRYTLIG